MKRVLISYILILFLSFPLFSAEQTVIKLSDFIEHSVRNNPDIFSVLYKLKESDAVELQTQAIYDVVFNVHYNRLYDKPFTDYSAFKLTDQTTDNFGGNLKWVVPYLGTRLKAGIDFNSNNLAINMPPAYGYPSSATFYNPEIFIEVQQPLLRNWLGVLDRFPISQSKLNKLVMAETVDDAIQTIMIDLYNMYFEWLHLYGQYNSFTRSVTNSNGLLHQTNQRFQMGLSDRSDISKIRIMNLEYMKSRDLASARFDVMSRKIFKWKTGRDIQGDLKIIPENAPVIRTDSKMGLDIESVRRMKILRLSRELLSEQLKKDKNEIMPELNFSLNYKLRNYNQSADKSFENFNYQNYTMGLNFTQPIGAVYSRGKIREVEAKLKKWDADAKSFERNYTQSYYELMKISDIYKKVLDYDRLLIEQSRIQHGEEEKKYFQGRADLYFVVQYRNSLLAFELLYLRDTIEAKKTEIQLLGLLDKIYRR